jgi:ribose transport system permease protein
MNNLNIKKTIKLIAHQRAVVAVLIIFVIMAFSGTNFFTLYNMMTIFNTSSIYLIIGFGATMVLISGGVDLSVGGVMATSGVITVYLINSGVPMTLAIIAAIAFGTIVGVINGYIVVYHKTEPFIITLGTGLSLVGLGRLITNAKPLVCTNKLFLEIANGKFFNTNYKLNLILMTIVAFVLIHYILRYTSFGRNLYAIGGDYEVAKYSGINVRSNKFLSFVICGTITAIAGVLLASKFGTANANYGLTTGFVIYSAVVVGGTSFAGGIGSVTKSAIGIIFIYGVLNSSMNMLRLSSFVQIILSGIIIATVIALDSYSRKRIRETV